MTSSTIAAIASPAGGGERGIVRISGPRARELVLATWRGEPAPDLSRRGFALGRFDDGRGTQPLLLLWMPAPNSFTREDVAELHLPGSPPLLAAALSRVLALGARLATPGEFTRRAFESGRIDLARAEGVLALIRARSDAEARAAARLVTGALDAPVDRAREALADARALVEAALDFAEDDTGHVPRDEIDALLDRAARAIDAALSLADDRAAPRPRAVLAGAPNAGKSSLFNALTRSRVLVSEAAGTTRDALAAKLDLDGLEIELVDAPGTGAAAGALDELAQEIARAQREGADVLVWVVDAARAGAPPDDRDLEGRSARLLLAWNKTDLRDALPEPGPRWRELAGRGWAATSARDGRGLDRLRSLLAAALADVEPAPAREVAARHRRGLEAARTELEAARAALSSGAPLELGAEHLRRATDGLDDVKGSTSAEELLDRIFARFCLGK